RGRPVVGRDHERGRVTRRRRPGAVRRARPVAALGRHRPPGRRSARAAGRRPARPACLPPHKELPMTRPMTLAGAALALALLTPAAALAAPKRVPLFMTLQKAPAPVAATDGRRHVAYEYTLGNNAGSTATIESIEVRARGRTLQRISAAQ